MIRYVNTPDKGKLNLRIQPTTSSGIITKIPFNTQLEVSYVTDEWYLTKYKDQSGYVMSKYLASDRAVTVKDLQQIYDSLKATLDVIEKIIK